MAYRPSARRHRTGPERRRSARPGRRVPARARRGNVRCSERPPGRSGRPTRRPGDARLAVGTLRRSPVPDSRRAAVRRSKRCRPPDRRLVRGIRRLSIAAHLGVASTKKIHVELDERRCRVVLELVTGVSEMRRVLRRQHVLGGPQLRPGTSDIAGGGESDTPIDVPERQGRLEPALRLWVGEDLGPFMEAHQEALLPEPRIPTGNSSAGIRAAHRSSRSTKELWVPRKPCTWRVAIPPTCSPTRTGRS